MNILSSGISTVRWFIDSCHVRSIVSWMLSGHRMWATLDNNNKRPGAENIVIQINFLNIALQACGMWAFIWSSGVHLVGCPLFNEMWPQCCHSHWSEHPHQHQTQSQSCRNNFQPLSEIFLCHLWLFVEEIQTATCFYLPVCREWW